MATAQNEKVLIVGAGIAGLVLAQILRVNDMPYEIFERDATWTGRNQGWSVGLYECLDDLAELLPKDLGDIQSISVSGGAHLGDSIAIYDCETSELVAKFGDMPFGEKGHLLRANRPKARDFLLQKLPVQIGKRFTHYTETRDDITAHFDDGTSATGTILIAADGARSKIRGQMLGKTGPQLEPSAWQPIFGEVDLPKAQLQALQEKGSTTIVGLYRDKMHFLWSIREVKDDGGAKCYWAVGWPTKDPAADEAWLKIANKAAKFERALAVAKPAPPFLYDLIEQTGVEGISPGSLVFREFVPPQALPRGRATLMGDAAHTMLPFRGAGANTAIEDACDLARILIKGWNAGDSVEWMLKQYEGPMLARGRDIVLSSRQAGHGADAVAQEGMKSRINTLSIDTPSTKVN